MFIFKYKLNSVKKPSRLSGPRILDILIKIRSFEKMIMHIFSLNLSNTFYFCHFFKTIKIMENQ